jgi:hypothetical protein
MTITLPAAIAAYLDAERCGDDEALESVFVAEAVVVDENQPIRGIAAIKTWKAEVREKFRYTVEPLTVEENGDKARLTARVTGDFPGSPVVLTYEFGIRDGRIVSLEIV